MEPRGDDDQDRDRGVGPRPGAGPTPAAADLKRKRRADSPDLVPGADDEPGPRPERSPSPAAARPAPAVARGRLQDFCRAHRQLQETATSGLHLASNAYHSANRVPGHANGAGMPLFRRYDPEQGRDVFFWARCIFCLARRVKFEHRHANGCDGWDKSGLTMTDRHLARCGCPVDITESRYVWLVCPKTEKVEREGRTVENGTPHWK